MAAHLEAPTSKRRSPPPCFRAARRTTWCEIRPPQSRPARRAPPPAARTRRRCSCRRWCCGRQRNWRASPRCQGRRWMARGTSPPGRGAKALARPSSVSQCAGSLETMGASVRALRASHRAAASVIHFRLAAALFFRRHSSPVCSVPPQNLVSASVDAFDEACVCYQHIRSRAHAQARAYTRETREGTSAGADMKLPIPRRTRLWWRRMPKVSFRLSTRDKQQ